ncbi:ATP-dependent DNA helicase [Microbacterium telephonicum]|uniref:DNA 3'-5' helicase n=1 Tax=Microbacterium telephonicum TaxID=1714841 RepID=A0A498C1C8_9MICO|nr:ATP-dependent DNA helicase [Microbacterium telephonicum]RLK49103.1 DNA helicase-2/ATP-dependent DNA helicase PcrA [Microbacterium telephonicum]
MSAPQTPAEVRSVSPEAIAAALGQFPPTPEQSAVISAPLTPALVVAGAGSGKTETMAGRVVWLVANGLVARDEVLGLTFTRKAAGELTERIHRRLRRLAEFEARGLVPHLAALHAAGALDVFARLEREGGSDAARRAALDELAASLGAAPRAAADDLLDRPTVSTYNSFADTIVRENAVRIGRDPEAAVLTESAAWLLMRRVVLASDDPRLEQRAERPSTIIDAALRLARDSVDNLADLDALDRFAERFAGVAERPSTNARHPQLADITAVAEKVGGLAVLTGFAREYRRQKQRLGLIDFADQVAGALEVVRSHESVAAELRARYRVVLLDEYQDTSVVQTGLLAELFRDTGVMAVGDPHQSIYGWRGASAGNLGDFARAFAPAGESARFTLLTSWRNATRILDAANAVLAPLAASSPVPVAELRARPDAPAGRVEVRSGRDVDAEADAVADWFAQVRTERARAQRTTTGALLFRSKKHMVAFADALGRRGIPHRILGLGGLLSTPEVVDVVSALRVVSDPQAGSALIRLLAGPRWGVGLADLRALEQLSRKLGEEEGASLVDALDVLPRLDDAHGLLAGFTPAALERLREAAGVFAGLRRAAGLPIPELVRLVEHELRLDIELAANETRGPARIAHAQLRAFVDELQGFLATDESGSLPALLAWLDRAEQLDEFAPRTEPPEEDVVQLLTIHGSKGLEWDAVAIVRAVDGELPSALRDGQGWLGFGALPYPFRGDEAWLPVLHWGADDAPSQQQLKTRIGDFKDGVRARHLEEERRLAYVAVTRAREHLLLSTAPWSGTVKPRTAGAFLREIDEALALGVDLDAEPGENPYLDTRRYLSWPLDPLGARRPAVAAAASAVQSAMAGDPAEPARDLVLLLAERDERRDGPSDLAPVRIPASRYKEFAADYAAAAAATSRPLPERPYRQTRLGTLFHAWVEQRSGLVGAGAALDDALWESDEESGAASADAADLARLQANFLASEWAHRRPIAVETEIDFAAPDLFGDGRDHVVICKLDAVYRREDRGGRIEIVDWKTGRSPRTAAERAERMLQLELYRRAYHVKHAVPLDEIDVVLYYVADGTVLRG